MNNISNIMFDNDSGRTIFINELIDESSEKEVCKSLIDFKNKSLLPITIFLSTWGGYCYCGFSIISILKSCENAGIKINMVANGRIMSMGVPIFLSVKKENRFILPDSTFMIHEISSFSYGSPKNIKIDAVETKRLSEEIQKLISNRTKITKKKLKNKLLIGDWYISASKFSKLGGGKIITSINDILTKQELKVLNKNTKIEKLKLKINSL